MGEDIFARVKANKVNKMKCENKKPQMWMDEIFIAFFVDNHIIQILENTKFSHNEQYDIISCKNLPYTGRLGHKNQKLKSEYNNEKQHLTKNAEYIKNGAHNITLISLMRAKRNQLGGKFQRPEGCHLPELLTMSFLKPSKEWPESLQELLRK